MASTNNRLALSLGAGAHLGFTPIGTAPDPRTPARHLDIRDMQCANPGGYRHLRNGVAASNTPGWHWVAGRHTRGKSDPANARNIATVTAGRFAPAPAIWPR